MRSVALAAVGGVLVAAVPVLAVLWCDVIGNTNDCQLVTSGLGCLSIAESSDGRTLAARQAFSQAAADAAALDGAGPGATIDLNGCSG